MKQQTVVEYFISQMKEKYNVTPKDTTRGFFNIIGEFTEIVEQAKKMEKEQIEKAFQRGISYKTEQNKSAYYSSKRFHKKYF